MNITKTAFFASLFAWSAIGTAQAQSNTDQSKFRQLGEDLPTPNEYRSASGAPGHNYWQQKADYEISAELNDDNQSLQGEETITYTNNSPDVLTYLWLQLDQNMRAKDSDTYSTETGGMDEKMTYQALRGVLDQQFDGGHKIEWVKDAADKPLKFTINKTMMRVDMPKALKTGEKYVFKVKWRYNINDRMKMGGRAGYEFFPKDGNYLYIIAKWFPRMAVYDDVNGWQHKQFLGRGEFALPFGDYKVKITVPADHLVASTGVLQNPADVMSKEEMDRFEKSKTAAKPVIIVTQAEAEKKEKTKSKEKRTWVYHAENVRDFAMGSSRKFIWDAKGVDIDGKKVMAMSFYPKEGNPLWEQYSTEAVAHTLEVYSKYTVPYPYPVAISVHSDMIGMEYPMICFNFGRPEPDGTYSKATKYGMLGVIIHEVGHNFFPMIINSDERQWTWMDEGLNSFLEYLTEQEWERGFPSNRGPAYKITDYMKGDKNGQVPIMTNSESIKQFGNNSYGKPAAALNILRETVMGRELFDMAFKEYAQRWAFKHPKPADFFRTMEDASAVDLDWFWRGWFYTTDNVDISIENVVFYEIDTKNPEMEKPKSKEEQSGTKYITDLRNQSEIAQTKVERNPELVDFYNQYDPFKITESDRERYVQYYKSLTEEEKQVIGAQRYFYEVTLKNEGGLVMPVILQFDYEDGTTEVKRIPAEIWRMDDKSFSKVFVTAKRVKSMQLDPFLETADTEQENNFYPRRILPSKFQLYKQERGKTENPMQGEKKK